MQVNASDPSLQGKTIPHAKRSIIVRDERVYRVGSNENADSILVSTTLDVGRATKRGRGKAVHDKRS